MKNLKVNKISVEYNTRLSGFGDGKCHYVISSDGKLKSSRESCPSCNSCEHVDNGYHLVEHGLIRALGLVIKISQFHCRKCGTFWSSDREFIDKVVQEYSELLKSLMLGSVRMGLSFESASKLCEQKIGKGYSFQYLHELYVNTISQIKEERFASASGVYYYDEQYLKENGHGVCRLTIKDAVTGKVIFDCREINAQDETIKRALHKALDGLPVDAFIIDMRREYPNIINELYPNAKIQWCIFHMYKLVWKELRDEFGKSIPLVQLYNAHSLFNIFFDHSIELQKLEELLKKFDSYKGKNSQENEEIEKCLRQEFSDFVKQLKKERRRQHKLIPRRTLKQSEEIFEEVKRQVLLYPTKLQKRIQNIDNNWEKFTLFQRDSRVQPTTNGIEHYFAATLAKTDKKDFRGKTAVTRELTACQAEWNGQNLFSTTNLVKLLNLVGMLFLAFPPT